MIKKSYTIKPETGVLTMAQDIDAVKFLTLIEAGWTVSKAGREFSLDEPDAVKVWAKIKDNRSKLNEVRKENERKYYAGYR